MTLKCFAVHSCGSFNILRNTNEPAFLITQIVGGVATYSEQQRLQWREYILIYVNLHNWA